MIRQKFQIEARRVFPCFRPEDRRVTSKDLLHLDDSGRIAGGTCKRNSVNLSFLCQTRKDIKRAYLPAGVRRKQGPGECEKDFQRSVTFGMKLAITRVLRSNHSRPTGGAASSYPGREKCDSRAQNSATASILLLLARSLPVGRRGASRHKLD